MDKEEFVLLYDKECPVCNNYWKLMRIRKDVGQLRIINARENSEIRNEVSKMGFDIDKGIVLKMNNKFYFGSDAVHAIALISSNSGLFNKLSYWVFKSKTRSYYLYPLLRMCRKLLLKILSKKKINNLEVKGNDRF